MAIVVKAMPESTPNVSHQWQPIADLPSSWHDLCRQDLHAVHLEWASERDLIRDQAKLQAFQERLAMLWAIETGIIERLYSVEPELKVQMLDAGMQALGQFHARGRLSTSARALIADQSAALEMVMDIVGGSRQLTAFAIREIHQRLTLSQETSDAEDQFGNPIELPLLKGAWKRQSNNPRRPDGSVHQYCPPEFVQDEIDQLLALHQGHRGVCPEVEAAWFHHRFAQIHPFQDGNGRVARALTSAIFLRANHLVLVIRDVDHREDYLDALNAADGGDLKPLVDLFADIQIADLRGAMNSIRSLRGESIIKVTDSIAERVRRRKDAPRRQAVGIMAELIGTACTRLEGAAAELDRALGADVSASVMTDDERTGWWSWQIIEAARRHEYHVDLDRPRRWVALRIGLPALEYGESRLVISIHAVGRAADLHSVTAFLTTRVNSGEGPESSHWESEVIAEQPFSFRAEMARPQDLDRPFRDWIERAIENGLSVWGERI